MPRKITYSSGTKTYNSERKKSYLSRRDWMKGIAVAGTVAFSSRSFASRLSGKAVASASLGAVATPKALDGRRVLLERILNHTFQIDANTRKVSLDTSNYWIFSTSVEHQNWLFSQGNYAKGGSKEGGLRLYNPNNTSNKNENAITAKEKGNTHNPLQLNLRDVEKADVRNARDECDEDIDVYWTGKSPASTYDYDDFYGLVKLKLDFTCTHCAIHTCEANLLWLKGELLARTDPNDASTFDHRALPALDIIADLIGAIGDDETEAWRNYKDEVRDHGADEPINVPEPAFDELKQVYHSYDGVSGRGFSNHGSY